MAKGKEKGKRDVEARIVDVREFSSKVKVLLYGDNGSQKTRTAATGPKPIIIDCNEKGTQSVRNYKDCKVFPAESWEDFVYAYWYLREAKHDRQTVVVDTLTMAQMLCIRAVLKQQEDRDPNRPPNMPDKRTWGQVGEMMKEQILRYRNLDMHVVFIAQKRKDFTEEEGAEDTFVPDISPASRAAATSSVGIIGYMYQGKIKKANKKEKKTSDKYVAKMLVGPHERYKTKDRTGLLGHIVTEPTMAQIIAANDAKEKKNG